MASQSRLSFTLAICKSLRAGDNRVAIPPDAIERLKAACWNNGKEHTRLHVLIEGGAGLQSGFSDEEYTKAGAEIVTISDILREADILVDVKQRRPRFILQDGINVFYAHVEKGQAADYLRELLAPGSVTLYSPETIFVSSPTGEPLRGVNLGYFAGVGAVHLAFEGIRISREQRGLPLGGPFASFPVVANSELDDITDAYLRFSAEETATPVAIIGSRRGLVASGAIAEFERARLKPVVLDRSITKSPDDLAAHLGKFDAIVNASQWFPGEPRIITRRQIAAMRDGAVFIDATCDQDLSSRGESEGDPVVGGVRYSYESRWTDPHLFYWVGMDRHTAQDSDPRARTSDDLRVLYNANGMIPGGRTTAKTASNAYAAMLFPYLVNIIRAMTMGAELPPHGLVLRRGAIAHSELRKLVSTTETFADLRPYCEPR